MLGVVSRNTITTSEAIRVGLLIVNGPVLLLLFGPGCLFVFLVRSGALPASYEWGVIIVFGVSFALAWTWWSLSVPRWRIWAYERVENIFELKQRAVDVGLTWPDGHVFGRTEIKSQVLAARERDLEARIRKNGIGEDQ